MYLQQTKTNQLCFVYRGNLMVNIYDNIKLNNTSTIFPQLNKNQLSLIQDFSFDYITYHAINVSAMQDMCSDKSYDFIPYIFGEQSYLLNDDKTMTCSLPKNKLFMNAFIRDKELADSIEELKIKLATINTDDFISIPFNTQDTIETKIKSPLYLSISDEDGYRYISLNIITKDGSSYKYEPSTIMINFYIPI